MALLFFAYSQMQQISRRRAATHAALIHLLVSVLISFAVGVLIFQVWYPDDLHQFIGGVELFLLVTAVDVACGPVLTFILFNPSKVRWKWRVDLTLIVFTQCAALVYGMAQVALARPVFVAFEGDRFRLVQAFDLAEVQLEQAPAPLRTLSLWGPAMLGVRLAQPTDPDFPQSVQASLQGLHPAFRPSRWVPYRDQQNQLVASLKSIEELKTKNPAKIQLLRSTLEDLGMTEQQVGFLPLVRDLTTDWSVLVRRSDAKAVAYIPLDGW